MKPPEVALAFGIGVYLGLAVMALVAGYFLTFVITGGCALMLILATVWWVSQ